MDFSYDLFYGNYVPVDTIKDTDEEMEILYQTVKLQREIENETYDNLIIEKVKKIIELNDRYSLLKSADAFQEGIKYAFKLMKEVS